jgi:2-oxo-3-hexenedioate decarboxylase
MPDTRVDALAHELMRAFLGRQTLKVLPSARDASFDLSVAYAVEHELVRLREASGHKPVGRKVGFANKAMWRVLKLDTVVWAHMYDDTVQYADGNMATLSVAHLRSPRLEPEIVFKLREPVDASATDAAAILSAVEWLALGFEVIDSVFESWSFQPSDFVAAFGLHAALIVGAPRSVDVASIPTLVEQLPKFKVRLSKGDQLVEEGSGRNSLRSPALCLGELASAIARRDGEEPLSAGELVSSGTLTQPAPIVAGEMWTAVVEGLDLPPLSLRVV